MLGKAKQLNNVEMECCMETRDKGSNDEGRAGDTGSVDTSKGSAHVSKVAVSLAEAKHVSKHGNCDGSTNDGEERAHTSNGPAPGSGE